VPLVPGSTDDCCARLRERRGLSDRQTANDWLAFLRALGLARETSRGFVRTDAEPTPERVREGLRDGVLLVPEALTALRDASPADPLTPKDCLRRPESRSRGTTAPATRTGRRRGASAPIGSSGGSRSSTSPRRSRRVRRVRARLRKRVRSPTSPAKRSETPCYGVRQPVRDKPFTRSRRR